MDFLQNLLDNSTTPVLTAFLLGLITALSPCPLATNIAAVGYIGRDVESKTRIFRNGILYTLGRVMTYTLLGAVLIAVLRQGASVFGIQSVLAHWGELLLGPVLVLVGLFMLFGNHLPLGRFGIQTGNSGERLAMKGGWGALLLGLLLALAFCPTSGVFYFVMLIPMSAEPGMGAMGYLLPVVFALATALPVLMIAWILAYSVNRIGDFYGKMKKIQRVLNLCVGILFLIIGLYYCYIVYLL